VKESSTCITETDIRLGNRGKPRRFFQRIQSSFS